VPCAHALRQPRGFHLSWNEALYRLACRRPQLTRGPAAWCPGRIRVWTPLLPRPLHPQRSGAFQAGHLMRIVPMFASLVVDTRRSLQCFASLVVDTRRSFAQAAQSRRTYNGICHFFSRDRAAQHNCHHPCWEAAYFLPCTRPPDVLRLMPSVRSSASINLVHLATSAPTVNF